MTGSGSLAIVLSELIFLLKLRLKFALLSAKLFSRIFLLTVLEKADFNKSALVLFALLIEKHELLSLSFRIEALTISLLAIKYEF